MTVVVPLSTFLRLISLFALSVFRASLCRAERLSFSFEKVMEAISNFLRSKYSFPVPLMVAVAVASLI